MKKNKLFVFILILTILLLFSTSALIDRCTLFSGTDGSEGDAEQTEKGDSETETKQDKEITKENNQVEVEEEKPSEEAADEEKNNEETEGINEEEDGETEQELQLPTIELIIYEGPTYSDESNICFYRVEAIVTGNPAPAVSFSRDDSAGAWGPFKTQINLDHPLDTYTLNAAAKNSEGEATASLELSWGCNPATKGGNRNPIVNFIDITGGTPLYWTDSKYDLNAITEDPDGDNLTYYWSASGGTFDDIYTNPVVWNTPGSSGTYSITVSVDDGNGGIASETINVFISQTSYSAAFTEEFPIVISEGGMVDNDGSQEFGTVTPLSTPYGVGDTDSNKGRTAYISFDISGLSGDILSAHLSFDLSNQIGDPSIFLPLKVTSTYWGSIPLSGAGREWQVFGTICQVNNPDFSADNGNLKTELLRAIEDGRDRFQIIVGFQGTPRCDYDNFADLWIYEEDDISLTITYRP